ncbi:MAG: adenylate/guanylate cyclase domain-containing protein [Deltaproteobacteria bacterium]|nr:MAG: adenylate/guanylate cyclase domain-containing protein [Deltaproteobacteria bacterium]
MTVSGLVLAGLLVLLTVFAWLLARARAESARLRRRLEAAATNLQQLQMSFSRFAPDELIERIIAEGVSTSGEKKEVTVLFADLVGFTALSERVDPPVLVRILNGYFERMSRAISDHRGHVSTFIGDGILAFFGALAPNPWQSNDAVQAALAMRAALATYNRELRAEGLPELSIGVGLQRGTGVVGLVGSRELMEFAFVGRAVNVAARVQGLTRQLGADIIVTEGVRRALDPRFALRALPPTEVKGIEKPIAIHAVERFEPGAPPGGAS